VAVAVAAAAAVAGDNQPIRETKLMKSKSNIMIATKTFAAAILLFGLASLALNAAPSTKDEAAADSQGKQQQFDTPQQACDSLVQAAATFDTAALKEILGPDGTDLISSDDPVMDKERAVEFAAKAKEKNSVEVGKKNANRAILTIGNDDFPIPIPVVAPWQMDVRYESRPSGGSESTNRRQ
jgi:hypothetical protein